MKKNVTGYSRNWKFGFRSKLIAGFLSVLIVISTGMMISQIRLVEVVNLGKDAIDTRYPVAIQSMKLKHSLYDLNQIVNKYVITGNQNLEEQYKKKYSVLSNDLNKLGEIYSKLVDSNNYKKKLIKFINEYDGFVKIIFNIRNNKELNSPAIFRSVNVLAPIIDRFIKEISAEVDNINYDEDVKNEHLIYLYELKYNWTQMNNNMRAVMANRGENNWNNFDAYSYAIKNKMEDYEKNNVLPDNNKNELFKRLFNEYISEANIVKDIASKNIWRKDVELIENNVLPKLSEIMAILTEFSNSQTQESQIISQQLSSQLGNLKYKNITIFIIGIILSILIMATLIRLLSRPLKSLTESANLVANGDMSTRVITNSNDELGELGKCFNKMIYRVNDLVMKNDALAGSLKSQALDLEFQQNALDEHAIVSIADNFGAITYINDKFINVSKYSSEELIGKQYSVVNSGFHSKYFFADMWDTIKAGQIWHGEVKNKSKEGDYYWVDMTIMPFLDERNNVYQFVSIHTDITKIKEQQEAQAGRQDQLRQQQNALMQLSKVSSLVEGDFNEASRSVLTIAAETLYVERAALWLMDRDSSFICKCLYNVVTGEYGDGDIINLNEAVDFYLNLQNNKVLNADDVFSDVRTLELTNQYFVPNKISSILISTIMESGKIAGIVTFEMTDSTRYWHSDEQHFVGAIADMMALGISQERRRISDERSIVLADELEEKNIELHGALSAAQALSHSKSEFLANMSHELRTPMNGIMGMITLMKDNCRPDEKADQMEYMEAAYNSSQNLLNLLNNLLDFSKIEAQRIELEYIEFSPEHIIKSVYDYMHGSASKNNIELKYFVQKNTPSIIVTDPTRLRQVLTNLVNNAIKFTSKGSVEMHLEQVSENTDSHILEFKVIDSGIGIPENMTDRIFEPFTQADGSTTRKYGGTGLGLSICKNIIEMMGGSIEVDSKEGSGTTIIFRIRVNRSIGVQYEGDIKYDFASIRLLIADNNKFNRDDISSGLSEYGIKPVWVPTGSLALQELIDASKKSRPYDYIIIDNMISDYDVIDLAQIIHHDSEINKTKVSLTVTHGQIGDGKQARQAGAEGYFTWPIDSDLIYKYLYLSVNNKDPDLLITRHLINEYEAINNKDDSGNSVNDMGYLSIIDAGTLKDLDGLMGDNYSGFITSIHEEANKTIAGLHDAIKNKNTQEAIRLISILKNTADTIGLKNLSSFCHSFIDNLGKNISVKQKHVDTIKKVIEKSINEINVSAKNPDQKGRIH